MQKKKYVPLRIRISLSKNDICTSSRIGEGEFNIDWFDLGTNGGFTDDE